MPDVTVGTVIAGKYRLDRPLARGGMGMIWVARHLPLDMPVAVKFMDANFAAMPEGRTRFEREAKAVALIQSPNVIHIHDYGLHDDLPYMAMELLQGEDLGARIRREGRLSMRVLADVIVQLCKGLRKAHEVGIIHRDLKPANVYLARDGDDEQLVKVLDFGVAKVAGLGEAGDATRTGVVVGSVHYMSPEQARGHKDIDHRSDLWSVGVIAFRALAGQLPFPGDQMGDVIVKICSDPLPSITALRPDLGPDVEAFFARALARKPDERFQSARELAQAFASLSAAGGELSSLGFSVRNSIPSATTMGTPMPGSSRDAAAQTSPSNAALASSAPQSSATPFSMSPPFSDPPGTPAIPQLTALPPPAGTLSSAPGAGDVALDPGRPRGTSRRNVVLIGLAAASVLAVAGVALTRSGAPPAPAAPSQAAAGTASAPATAAPSALAPATASAPAAPSASASAPAPATASASAQPSAIPAKAAPKVPAAPHGTAPPKINSELGF